MITILQNFIVGKQERLDVLRDDILPDISDFFSEYDFCINYNSTKNFDSIHSLYKNHVDKLTFYNDLTMDWGKTVQSMLSEIDTKYVFIMPEDYILHRDYKNYFNSLIEELDNLEVDDE